jgi:hypothetical protein
VGCFPLTGRVPFCVAVAAGHPIGGGSVGFLQRETAVGEPLGFKQGQRIGTARVAEFESDLIRLRIKEGVKVAKAKGACVARSQSRIINRKLTGARDCCQTVPFADEDDSPRPWRESCPCSPLAWRPDVGTLAELAYVATWTTTPLSLPVR